MKKLTFLVMAAFILLTASAEASGIRWIKKITNLEDSRMNCVLSGPASADTLYIGTDRRLYRSDDSGSTWRSIFYSKGEFRGINEIKIFDDTDIYIATENGLYKSSDSGASWQAAFRRDAPDLRNVKSFAVVKNGRKAARYYILTDSGLYEMPDINADPVRLFTGDVMDRSEEEPGDEEAEISDDTEIILKRIESDGRRNLYLSTTKGIFMSSDRGKNWARFNDSGLTNRDINYCLVSKKAESLIYAATRGGVFRYKSEEGKWENVSSGLNSINAACLAFGSPDEDYIIALADNVVYRTIDEADYAELFRSGFNDEPTVKEVQDMAVRYAEVHPDKINKWRQRLKLRGLLPKVTLGIDHSISDTYEIYTNSSAFYTVVGPKDNTEGWDISFSWDMGDLIYNEHQTSIDVRSKLMVQLRDDILNEVVHYYFERRRLQMELASAKSAPEAKAMEKYIRLEELTASLDALTGGAYSDAIESGRKAVRKK